MRILDKYIARSYLLSFLFSITLLIVIGVIGDVLGFLDDIFKNNIPLDSIIRFYFYLAPFAFVNMTPFACLISAVYVFNTLSKNHEIYAVITSGLCLDRLVRPVMLVTLLLCIVTFIVNDRFVPGTMKKATAIRQEKLEKSGSGNAHEMKDVAVYGEGGRLIFAKSFDTNTNSLHNVIIQKQDKEHHITEKISARIVTWDKNGSWNGIDVIIFNTDAEGNFTKDPEVSKKKTIIMEETPSDFVDNQWDPKYMSFKQLKKYIEAFRFGGANALERLRVDLQYKFAFPFAAFFAVLIGIPFSIETGRTSALIGIVKGISVGMIYFPLTAVCLALGKGGWLSPVVSAWLGGLVFLILGFYFIYKKS